MEDGGREEMGRPMGGNGEAQLCVCGGGPCCKGWNNMKIDACEKDQLKILEEGAVTRARLLGTDGDTSECRICTGLPGSKQWTQDLNISPFKLFSLYHSVVFFFVLNLLLRNLALFCRQWASLLLLSRGQ